MNSFSNMEINDLLDNRFRLDTKHTPNYLAECFQRLFPTLGRMGLSTVVDEMARANHRAFNSSSLPIRGETLSLGFFFELWKREFRFEGGIYDKFVFSDELRLAFRINSREFWEVLIRVDREIGTYLKDCFELFQYRELPQEISFTLRAGGGSLDYKDASKIKDLLPRTNSSLIKLEDIAKACVSIWGMPKFFDERRLIEELCRENNIRRAGGSASITREPCVPFPLKNIANLRVDFLKRAAEHRFRENQKIEELSFREFEIQEIEAPAHSLPFLSQQELLVRGDYRGHGDPVEPAYPPLEHRQDGGTMKASTNAITEIKRSEFFVPYFYDDRDSSNPRKRVYKKNKHLVKGTLTIGYGTTKITPEREKAFDHGVTETQAEAWVIEDIENIFLADLQRYTKGLFLNQNQFDALMSVMYNMGATKFYKDSGIMEAIRTKDHKKIANAIENSYLAVPKHFQNGIKDRRLRERSLYERIP